MIQDLRNSSARANKRFEIAGVKKGMTSSFAAIAADFEEEGVELVDRWSEGMNYPK